MKALAFATQVSRRRQLMATIGKKPPLRAHRFARQRFPRTVELAYLADLRHMLWAVEQQVKSRLFPLLPELARRGQDLRRSDAVPEPLGGVMAGLRNGAKAVFTDPRIEAVAEKAGHATSEAQRRALGQQIQTALGIQVPLNDPKLGDRLRSWTTENVALISDMPEEMLNQIERRTLAGISAGDRWEEIAADLEDRLGIAEDRAALIARDQVGKFYGAVQQARQEDLGLTHYFWRGTLDNRERDEHVLREGERFAWDDAPEDGHPGEPINCRCTADPDFTPILDRLNEG